MASANAWLDGTYPRKTLRQLDSATLGASSSRVLGAPSGITPGVPTSVVSCPTNTTWQVTPITGVLDLESDATMGPSRFVISSNDTGTINAAHATLDRIDLLYIYTDDATQTPADVRYRAGTAASTPVAPALSASGEMALATLRIPGGGGVPAITWVAPWTCAAGGIRPTIGSGGRPASGYVGQFIDDGGLLRWNGSSWTRNIMVDTGWLDVVSLGSGWTVPAGNVAQIRQLGYNVKGRGYLSNSTFNSSTPTTGAVLPSGISLPDANQSAMPVAQNNSTTGRAVYVQAGGSIQFTTTGATSAFYSLAGIDYFVG